MELRVEIRAGEVLWVIAPFGAVALLLTPMAVGTDPALLTRLGVGMYWIVVLLFGVLVALRQSATDSPERLAVLRLAGVRPAARLCGRALGTAAALLIFELLLIPVTMALYQPQLGGWVWMVPVLLLVAFGIAVLGTLAGAVAAGLGGRSSLGPLLVCPVALPLLLAATEVHRAAVFGQDAWSWLLLAVTTDLLAFMALVVTAAAVEELL